MLHSGPFCPWRPELQHFGTVSQRILFNQGRVTHYYHRSTNLPSARDTRDTRDTLGAAAPCAPALGEWQEFQISWDQSEQQVVHPKLWWISHCSMAIWIATCTTKMDDFGQAIWIYLDQLGVLETTLGPLGPLPLHHTRLPLCWWIPAEAKRWWVSGSSQWDIGEVLSCRLTWNWYLCRLWHHTSYDYQRYL